MLQPIWREFLREILYKNVAIISIQHGKFILFTPLAIFPYCWVKYGSTYQTVW